MQQKHSLGPVSTVGPALEPRMSAVLSLLIDTRFSELGNSSVEAMAMGEARNARLLLGAERRGQCGRG